MRGAVEHDAAAVLGRGDCGWRGVLSAVWPPSRVEDVSDSCLQGQVSSTRGVNTEEITGTAGERKTDAEDTGCEWAGQKMRRGAETHVGDGQRVCRGRGLQKHAVATRDGGDFDPRLNDGRLAVPQWNNEAVSG
jgi:hypothetical protein